MASLKILSVLRYFLVRLMSRVKRYLGCPSLFLPYVQRPATILVGLVPGHARNHPDMSTDSLRTFETARINHALPQHNFDTPQTILPQVDTDRLNIDATSVLPIHTDSVVLYMSHLGQDLSQPQTPQRLLLINSRSLKLSRCFARHHVSHIGRTSSLHILHLTLDERGFRCSVGVNTVRDRPYPIRSSSRG